MKRKIRSHAWRPTYSSMDVLMADPHQPMRPANYRHQLTRMHLALQAMERGDAPTADDWRLIADAYNLVEQLAIMGLAQDAGLLPEAQREIAIAGARHVDEGKPLRLSGNGIAVCRELLATWQAALAELPERDIVRAHAQTERRMHRLYVDPRVSRSRVVVV